MHVREATVEDAHAILDLYTLPHVTPFMRKPTAAGIERAIADREARSAVIEIDRAIVAYALVKNVAADWGISEFSQLLVHEARRGYGRALVRWAQAEIFERRRAHRLYLEVVGAQPYCAQAL